MGRENDRRNTRSIEPGREDMRECRRCGATVIMETPERVAAAERAAIHAAFREIDRINGHDR
jgi:L-aminopeptidase/D-esterase-like protein